MKDRTHSDANKRLARIAGQVSGLQKMVDEERYCVDILTQVAALRAALRFRREAVAWRREPKTAGTEPSPQFSTRKDSTVWTLSATEPAGATIYRSRRLVIRWKSDGSGSA